ncbi:MAG: serine hydrolase [Sphingomonadaceae bacterium]
MMLPIRSLIFLLVFALSWTVPTAPAIAAEPSETFRARAGQLMEFFAEEAEPAEMFTDSFLTQVPEAQLDAIAAQIEGQFGKALEVERIEAAGPHQGKVFVRFEKAVVEMEMRTQPDPPHLIAGLLITGSETIDDSPEALLEELRRLPGTTSFAIARLDADGPNYLHRHNAGEPLASGSAFKLFILAELARQIEAGELGWSDVVALDRASLPSGILQDWPQGSPLTLHTLASLMISRSDNTATDMLLHALGREKVEALLPTLGLADPARNRPFLSTYEFFVLKGLEDDSLAAAYADADEAGRRALLDRINAVPRGDIDLLALASEPKRIDRIEWFASAEDFVRTMDWLRRHGGETALEIMAINPGIGETTAEELAYLGFKGGSEPGVINLSFLLRNEAGQWYAVSGAWNNPDAAVENATFVTLMSRAVQLLR